MASNYKFIFIISALVFLSACKKDESVNVENNNINLEESRIRSEIYRYMLTVYLWNNQISHYIDTTFNIDPETFFYALTYPELDRWSFITSKMEYELLEKGLYFGHGIMFAYDEYGDLRVAYVLKNTKAYTSGIRRGWKVTKINNLTSPSYEQLNKIVGESFYKVNNYFEFLDNDNQLKTIYLEKELITINPILLSTCIPHNGKKIGYLALVNFMGNNIKEQLDDIFNDFNFQAIDELVIDLRYNVGGDLEASQHLASLIIGKILQYSLFLKFNVNSHLSTYYPGIVNDMLIQNLPNSLVKPIERIFVITSGLTAAASEAFIKGIEPFITTHLIGTRTQGKPVVLLPIELKSGDYAIFPVVFTWENINDQSCGYTGIGVNCQEFDDLTHDFGDPEELCLKQALHFISTGSYLSQKKRALGSNAKYELKGIHSMIGFY